MDPGRNSSDRFAQLGALDPDVDFPRHLDESGIGVRAYRLKRLMFVALFLSLTAVGLVCTKEESPKIVTVFGEGDYSTGKKSASAFEDFIRSFVAALSSVCGGPDSVGLCLLAEFCETVNRVPLDHLITGPEIQSISGSIRIGRSAFHEANAKRYADAFDNLQMALSSGHVEALADSTWNDVFALPLLTGVQKDGDPCFSVDECERGLVCNLVGCPGRCQRLPGAGEPCLPEFLAEEQESILSFASSGTVEVEQCDASSTCDEKTSTCVARRVQGDPCLDSGGCVKSLYCRSGRCVSFKEAGGSCVNRVDRCALGLTCREGACKPPAKEGEPCSGSPSACTAGLICRAGGCRLPGVEGEPCARLNEDLDFAQCQTGLTCSAEGKCSAKLGAGTECNRIDVCKGYCDGLFASGKGTCRDAFPSAGEACGAEGECEFCAQCDGKTKICLAVGIGAACMKDSDCAGDELACDAASSRCAIKPVLGEACDPNVGCSSDFYCGPDGACRAGDRFRYESCAYDSQCVSDHCEGRSCAGGACRPPEIPAAAKIPAR